MSAAAGHVFSRVWAHNYCMLPVARQCAGSGYLAKPAAAQGSTDKTGDKVLYAVRPPSGQVDNAEESLCDRGIPDLDGSPLEGALHDPRQSASAAPLARWCLRCRRRRMG